MRARVGAMPLPPKASSQHDQQSQVQGSNRIRVHSGMSLEVSLQPTPTITTNTCEHTSVDAVASNELLGRLFSHPLTIVLVGCLRNFVLDASFAA